MSSIELRIVTLEAKIQAKVRMKIWNKEPLGRKTGRYWHDENRNLFLEYSQLKEVSNNDEVINE